MAAQRVWADPATLRVHATRGPQRTVCIVVRCCQPLWFKRQGQPSGGHGAVGEMPIQRCGQSLCRPVLVQEDQPIIQSISPSSSVAHPSSVAQRPSRDPPNFGAGGTSAGRGTRIHPSRNVPSFRRFKSGSIFQLVLSRRYVHRAND
jgi:hypothetical protein